VKVEADMMQFVMLAIFVLRTKMMMIWRRKMQQLYLLVEVQPEEMRMP